MTDGRSNSRTRTTSSTFVIGTDVISRLIPDRHPMIMVDHVTHFQTSPQQRLSAERYVSANEPVFACHFPDLKLWPGIHTIEGLRQCCSLLEALRRAYKENLLGDLLDMQSRHMLRPQPDEALYRRVLDALERIRRPEELPMTLRVKLLAPVFPGCVIKYDVRRNGAGDRRWSVRAEVSGQDVARGEIACRPLGGQSSR